MANKDFFEDDCMPISVDEPIDMTVYIDLDDISHRAEEDSQFMLKDLTKIYGNTKFMEEHPDYKKRLDVELESIRLLLKMRRADEITHDILIKQIGLTPNNASLYSSLNRLQTSLLSIQTKLDETVKNVNNLLKNYQLEIPFDSPEEESKTSSEAKGMYRGSKAFITDMLNGKMPEQHEESEMKQLDLFDDSEEFDI